jgi:hypothetical protein
MTKSIAPFLQLQLLTGIDFLEVMFVPTLVGMVLDGHFPVGFLDGLGVDILFHLKGLVQLGGIDVGGRPAAATRPSTAAASVGEMFCKRISSEKHGCDIRIVID